MCAAAVSQMPKGQQIQPARESVQLATEDITTAPSLTGVEIEERGMMRCIMKHERGSDCNVGPNWTYPQNKLDEAYEKCAYITEHYAKTFFLGTQLMAPEKARAVCAIYVWCRRTDELVDGPNADRITPEVSFCTMFCICVAVECHGLRLVCYGHVLQLFCSRCSRCLGSHTRPTFSATSFIACLLRA